MTGAVYLFHGSKYVLPRSNVGLVTVLTVTEVVVVKSLRVAKDDPEKRLRTRWNSPRSSLRIFNASAFLSAIPTSLLLLHKYLSRRNAVAHGCAYLNFPYSHILYTISSGMVMIFIIVIFMF